MAKLCILILMILEFNLASGQTTTPYPPPPTSPRPRGIDESNFPTPPPPRNGGTNDRPGTRPWPAPPTSPPPGPAPPTTPLPPLDTPGDLYPTPLPPRDGGTDDHPGTPPRSPPAPGNDRPGPPPLPPTPVRNHPNGGHLETGNDRVFPAPLPPPPPESGPAICLGGGEETPSFYNEACKSVADCYSNFDNSTLCTKGVCTCNEGYVPRSVRTFGNGDKMVLYCGLAPGLYQSCTTTCRAPTTCADASKRPLLIDRPAPPVGEKLCLCQKPYVDKNGICWKDCKADEVYDHNKGSCDKRCTANEINVMGPCKKLAKLGEPCEEKLQCSTPFAVCQSGKCVCGDGFQANKKNDACEAKNYWCPTGDPIKNKGAVVDCTLQKRKTDKPVAKKGLPPPPPPPGAASFAGGPAPPPPPPGSELDDSCADDQFCLVTSGQGYKEDGATGHCCPKPKLSCPKGVPHPNATCVGSLGGDASIPYCPSGTHTCLRLQYASSFEASVCCPLACTFQHVLVKGQCYPKRRFGDQCDVDEQCKGFKGSCVKGVCGCGPEFKVEGSDYSRYCDKICKDGEIKDGGECWPEKNLGDACEPWAPPQCPRYTYCHLKKHKCSCMCGGVKLDEKSCGPEPRCNNQPLNTTTPTFCKPPGQEDKAVATAVKTCPTGQYCARYMPNTGLCCPTPEKPVCPDGSLAKAKCDPRHPPVVCGEPGKFFCHRYLDPAGTEDPTTGYACCPWNVPPPEPPIPIPMGMPLR